MDESLPTSFLALSQKITNKIFIEINVKKYFFEVVFSIYLKKYFLRTIDINNIKTKPKIGK